MSGSAVCGNAFLVDANDSIVGKGTHVANQHVCLATADPGTPTRQVLLLLTAIQPDLLSPSHRKGPVTGPFRSHALRRRRATGSGLVNRCFRYGDPDVGADVDPVDIGLSHDDFDHPDFDAVRRVDSSAEPERSEAGDL